MNSFEQLRDGYLNGNLNFQTHQVPAEQIEEFPEEQLCFLEKLTDDNSQDGYVVLKENRWARLILNGGMATRFGGRVKGICEVYDDKTFLELKLEHLKRVEDFLELPEVPVALMNSHATHDVTVKYLEDNNYFGRQKLTTFVQRTYPRLTESGELFSASEGKDRAPCGHGDFLEALVESGTLENWKSSGVSHLDFSNIDNLGATVEMDMLGAFVQSGCHMAIELAHKNPGDKGGAACLRRGSAGVLEGIYFDPEFDQDRLPWFNTNNLMFSVEGLEEILNHENFSLPWNPVKKNVSDHTVIQFERIAIDTVFGFNQKEGDRNVLFFAVPREGVRGRFYPVKSPEDLLNLRETLKSRLTHEIGNF